MKASSVGYCEFSKSDFSDWVMISGCDLLYDRDEQKPIEGDPNYRNYALLGKDGAKGGLRMPGERFCLFISRIMLSARCDDKLIATCPVLEDREGDTLWCYVYYGTKKHMWTLPLNKKLLRLTNDSMSFQNIDISKRVEIPFGNHVGAFGYERRFDVHKGIDLYANEGDEVYAVEDGIVTNIRHFTGEVIGTPWWNNTDAISISGWSGNVVYGELEVDQSMSMGKEVRAGDKIGVIRTVLKKDKGRPTSMLHLAVHKHGVQTSGVWEIGKPCPSDLIDPAVFLSPLLLI